MNGRSLRVCLLTYRGNPRCGGQGVYVRHLSRELTQMGHTVDVWSGPPYPELLPGVGLTQTTVTSYLSRSACVSIWHLVGACLFWNAPPE